MTDGPDVPCRAGALTEGGRSRLMTRAAYPNTAMRTLGTDGAPAEITRATILEIAEDSDPGGSEPLPSGSPEFRKFRRIDGNFSCGEY
jgi:hypothetical protein